MRDGHAVQLTIAALIAACLAATSWLVALLPSVPLTLQTFFVVLAALLLRPRWAGASMLVYLALGCAGLPVFAGGRGGIAVLVGPTGGYLIAFVLAASLGAFIAGAAGRGAGDARSNDAGKPGRRFWLRGALVAGATIILIDTLGSLWLSYSAHLPLAAALLAGAVPFLVGDVLKATAALFVAHFLRKTRSTFSA